MTAVSRVPGDLLERERELDRAMAALDQALDGQGTAVAFLGPPGIGKTSLLGALVDGAGAAGTAVLAARGFNTSGSESVTASFLAEETPTRCILAGMPSSATFSP